MICYSRIKKVVPNVTPGRVDCLIKKSLLKKIALLWGAGVRIINSLNRSFNFSGRFIKSRSTPLTLCEESVENEHTLARGLTSKGDTYQVASRRR